MSISQPVSAGKGASCLPSSRHRETVHICESLHSPPPPLTESDVLNLLLELRLLVQLESLQRERKHNECGVEVEDAERK